LPRRFAPRNDGKGGRGKREAKGGRALAMTRREQEDGLPRRFAPRNDGIILNDAKKLHLDPRVREGSEGRTSARNDEGSRKMDCRVALLLAMTGTEDEGGKGGRGKRRRTREAKEDEGSEGGRGKRRRTREAKGGRALAMTGKEEEDGLPRYARNDGKGGRGKRVDGRFPYTKEV